MAEPELIPIVDNEFTCKYKLVEECAGTDLPVLFLNKNCCKACHSQRLRDTAKEYYQNHREELLLKSKNQYLVNKETKRADAWFIRATEKLRKMREIRDNKKNDPAYGFGKTQPIIDIIDAVIATNDEV